MEGDNRYRILPFGAANRIRQLRLNAKKRRHKIRAQQHEHQNGPNKENIIRVKRMNTMDDCNIIIGQCNTQSLKVKHLQISELLKDYSLDILVLMETWLTTEDNQWIEASEFNRNGYKIYTANRTSGRRGGGVALISKSHFKVNKLYSAILESFKHCTWQIDCKKIAITVTAIYHLPYSLRNKITNNQFLDHFTAHMTKLIPLHNNNIILGDFNLHLSNDDDIDAAVFNDTIEALGLYQHTHFTTHKSGNQLDLIISEISEKVNIKTVNSGPYISDHQATIVTINVKRTRPK